MRTPIFRHVSSCQALIGPLLVVVVVTPNWWWLWIRISFKDEDVGKGRRIGGSEYPSKMNWCYRSRSSGSNTRWRTLDKMYKFHNSPSFSVSFFARGRARRHPVVPKGKHKPKTKPMRTHSTNLLGTSIFKCSFERSTSSSNTCRNGR